MAWILMVKNAINKAVAQPVRMIQIVNGALYAKPSSHLLMKYHASGAATKKDMLTSVRKSLDKRETIPVVLAPSTFRMPISLVRCSTLNVVRPNNPRQEIKMAIIVKYLIIAASLSSAI
jgi:hypothetical protein